MFLKIEVEKIEFSKHSAILRVSGKIVDGPEDVARGSYLVFGVPPEGAGVKIIGESENQFIVDYRTKHPVLNYVNMDNLLLLTAYLYFNIYILIGYHCMSYAEILIFW